MPKSIYQKLTPTKRGFFGYTQLWLAPDHILLLNSSQLAEDYKRFAFTDIQSIVVTELPSRLVPQIIMVLAALAWSGLWFAVDLPFFKWFFVITGALALSLAIRDIARGARCRCYLHTRVSRERLVPVSRMKIAAKFLATVRPMTEAVQGSLAPQQLDAIETPYTPSPDEPPALISTPGYIPEVLFGLFLIDAILIWATVRFTKIPEISGILTTTLFAELLLIVVALIRRKGRDARVIIYVLIALSVIGLGYDSVTVSRHLVGWYLAVIDKAKASDKTPVFITLFSAGTGATIAWAWRSAVGILGLAAAFWERRKK